MNWDMAPDGRVFANWQFDDYAVHVWNPDGTKDRVIRRDYAPRVRSEEERERAYQRMSPMLRRIPNSTLTVSDSDQAITGLYVRDDGSAWVLTSRGAKDAPDGAIGQFDVYDLDGRFRKQVTLMGEGDQQDDGFFFAQDRVFVVLGLQSARMAQRGGGETSSGDELEMDDADPITIICYALDGVNL